VLPPLLRILISRGLTIFDQKWISRGLNIYKGVDIQGVEHIFKSGYPGGVRYFEKSLSLTVGVNFFFWKSPISCSSILKTF